MLRKRPPPRGSSSFQHGFVASSSRSFSSPLPFSSTASTCKGSDRTFAVHFQLGFVASSSLRQPPRGAQTSLFPDPWDQHVKRMTVPWWYAFLSSWFGGIPLVSKPFNPLPSLSNFYMNTYTVYSRRQCITRYRPIDLLKEGKNNCTRARRY